MIDINDPAELDALMTRVQARRVAQAYQGAGKVVPPGARKILAGDSDDALERETEAYAACCAARGVECIRTIGISEFQPV